jgi:hypothetical protein
MDEMDEENENDFSVKFGADEPSDLAVYGATDVRSAIAARNKLAAEQQARYDAQAKEIMARRAGPSFSERMFQLSAALATPTEQRGFGGILANVAPVLAAQQRAKRQDELSRREALEELEAKRLTQQMGLANQDVNTQVALARIAKQGTGSEYAYMQDRGGYGPKPGIGGNAPMPDLNQFGYYVITDPRQLIYLPPNTPVVYPGGDQTKPKYTPANPTR